MSDSKNRARELRDRYESGDRTAIDAIREAAGGYRFYHNIEIVPGVLTKGFAWANEYVNRVIAVMKRFDFKGKRVLDIGCRDGRNLLRLNSSVHPKVVGIDNDLSNGLTDFLIPFKRSKVKAYQRNLNDLCREQFGEFDLVVFAGVLYHLRYPIWGLRRIADVLKPSGVLIIESAFIEGFADLPVLFCPIGTDSPYEPTSITYFNEAGIADTLVSIGFSEIQCHDSFCEYACDEVKERKYLEEKFPKFLEAYSDHHKLSLYRRIFSCVKEWSVDDQRIDPAAMSLSQAQILQRYWDGIHGLHTRWAIDHDHAG